MHVKIVGSVTEEFFEYAHRDHLGSIEVVTDDNGNVLDNLAFESFGSRKTKDWTANISSTELNALLDLDWDHTRKARGFTDHEHLDRTGFIHMNGRVYDPVLGRFLSPDPIVQLPAFSQSWNRYSYVSNAPTSLTDPSGYVFECSGDCWNFDDFFFHDFFYHNDPRYDDVFFYDECDFNGCEPVDPFANEISQTDTIDYGQAVQDLLERERQRQENNRRRAQERKAEEERAAENALKGLGGMEAGTDLFGGVFGVSGTFGGMVDSNGKICAFHQECVQVGFGGYVGIAGQGITGRSKPLKEGVSRTFGVFAVGSLGLGGFGTLDANMDGVVLAGGGSSGLGGAAGVQVCSITVHNCTE
jgi:RHS repeat-associated protein